MPLRCSHPSTLISVTPWREPAKPGQSLEASARSLGISDRVRFLGAVPDADLPNLLNVAAVYVGGGARDARQGGGLRHRARGGFGLRGAASWAALPAGSPTRSATEKTGLLADGADPSAVAAALRRLLEDEPLRARLGGGGRAAVESFYNWVRVTRDMREIASEYSP